MSGCIKFRRSWANPTVPAPTSQELKQAIKDAAMPPEAEEQALRELARLERMSDGAAEYSMTRTYLDWLVAMPWSKSDTEQLDIEQRADHAR